MRGATVLYHDYKTKDLSVDFRWDEILEGEERRGIGVISDPLYLFNSSSEESNAISDL